MEMRKFIVTLHDDGSMSWNEYEEPNVSRRKEPNVSRREVFREAKSWLDRMLHSMPWNGRKVHPGMSNEWYAGYTAACQDLWMENGY